MSATITISNTTIVQDETSGVQTGGVATSFEDNNDLDVASLSAAVQAALSGLGTPIGQAKSGGTFVQVVESGSGGFVGDLSLVGSAGLALNGVATTLSTINGQTIYLFSLANNDVVVGRVANDPTSAAAFALVLDSTISGATASAALWVVQYTPLQHADAGALLKHDDVSNNLAGLVFVRADTSAEVGFTDLSKAPSGQNDWLAFGPTGSSANVQMLVTGLNPRDNNADTSGDTVNTSTIGIGTNAQSVAPGLGVRVDFMESLNLPPQGGGTGDTKKIEGIHYTGGTGDRHEVSSMSFTIVQTNNTNGPNGTVKAQLTLVNENMEAEADLGSAYVGHLADDRTTDRITVSQVKVNGVVLVPDAGGSGAKLTISNGVATVDGLKKDDVVTVSSTGGVLFDRVLIENTGTKGSFDVGAFKVSALTGTHTLADVGSKVVFEDDGPQGSITLSSGVNVQVSETALGTSTTEQLCVANTANYGADGAATNAALLWKLAISDGDASGLATLDGVSIKLYTVDATHIEGRVGDSLGDKAFSVSIASDGKVTLTQDIALKHEKPTNDLLVTLNDGAISASLTLTDKDGDTHTSTQAIGARLRFADATPDAIDPEDAVVPNSAGSSDPFDLTIAGQTVDDFTGADDGDVVFGSDLHGTKLVDANSAFVLSGAEQVWLYVLDDGHTLLASTDSNAGDGLDAAKDVFTVTLDPDGDAWSVDVSKPLDSAGETTFDDFSKVPAGQQAYIFLENPDGGTHDVLFTGKDPAKASKPDTVNTSTTGLGSNNQSVDAGEAIRIDFVDDVSGSNLKNMTTLRFDSHYSTDQSGFFLSQTQSGSAVTARVSIYDESDEPAAGAAFPAGEFGDDAVKKIAAVRVVNTKNTANEGDDAEHIFALGGAATHASLPGITVTFVNGGDFVDIAGLLKGYNVYVDGVASYERMLVQNVGTKGFDLGGVILGTEGVGAPVPLELPLDVIDGDNDLAGGTLSLTFDPALAWV